MPASSNPFDTGGAPAASGGFPGSGVFPPGTPGTERTLAVAGPPTVYLWVAAGLALVGIVATALILVFDKPWLSVAGWALAGPLALGLIGHIMAEDTRSRAAPLYVEQTWLKTAMWATAAAAAIGTVAGSLGVAFWAGRGW